MTYILPGLLYVVDKSNILHHHELDNANLRTYHDTYKHIEARPVTINRGWAQESIL